MVLPDGSSAAISGTVSPRAGQVGGAPFGDDDEVDERARPLRSSARCWARLAASGDDGRVAEETSRPRCATSREENLRRVAEIRAELGWLPKAKTQGPTPPPPPGDQSTERSSLEGLRMQYDMELAAHRETMERLLAAKDALLEAKDARIHHLEAELERPRHSATGL